MKHITKLLNEMNIEELETALVICFETLAVKGKDPFRIMGLLENLKINFHITRMEELKEVQNEK